MTPSSLDWVKSFLRATHPFMPLDVNAFKVFVLSYCHSLATTTLDQCVHFLHYHWKPFWVHHFLSGLIGMMELILVNAGVRYQLQ